MSLSFETVTDEEFETLRTNGIKVNYAIVCARKLWLYSKGIRMESQSDRVALARLLHEHSYPNLSRRDFLIDNLIRIDLLLPEDKVLEIKYSSKMAEAARIQIAYYLLYLERLGARSLIGELRFPREKRREEVCLTPELKEKALAVLKNIREIESQSSPPIVEFMPICRACSYCELCWG
ncbi:MAG: CRISPR-associated protein Cas4 [Armatimonadetes bacterium]|nr:CRISPR-associated protein Cas4 [Armatimonadota bacterium]MDW8121936.1 CRISPR-associated protein Cas4 [Armatimonadota bacterium]